METKNGISKLFNFIKKTNKKTQKELLETQQKMAGFTIDTGSSNTWKQMGSNNITLSTNTLWFAVALQKNAENVSSVEFVLRPRSEKTKEVVEHPFLSRIDKPNNRMGRKLLSI